MWLFHARVFKSRSLATERIQAGGIRLNGQPCRKPGHPVGPGDILTIATGSGQVRALEVLAPGTRRGPATEAATLYRDLTDLTPSRLALNDPDEGAN
ncbi:RNA-binding S4 domain-containing protein [Paracoccus pacificus]|uniref:RNA-binding S4 domain-containing protein n=1 Tax=Paracoccus pacificus TaxID=1463598 RepID=A0ABW4RBH7_9RHOB